MGWDNAGNYSRQHNFSADASAGIKILAARMDAELDDFASAMTIALTKNGQNVPTGNLPMGGFRHINVGAPVSVNNYMRSREFIENTPIFMTDAESSADRISVSAQYFTSVSANQAPGDGTRVLVRVGSDKSSAALYLNGHSANVEFQDGNRAADSLVSGGIYEFLYSSVDAAWKVTAPDFGRTAAERAASVTPTNFRYPVLNVLRYGAVGDGSTDDAAAIQRAVDVAEVGGGTVIFPSDKNYKWGMGSQVTISSLYPVNLIGNMRSNPNSTANSSYIKPLNNITGSMFKYQSPTGSLNEGGGGLVRGLSFLDDSALSASALDDRRVFTMDAAINLDAFSHSRIEECHFNYLRGSAIRAGFCVKSNFNNLLIQYCGATGFPAFDHPSDASRAMQSCVVSGLRSEVNFDEPYIYVHNNTNCQDNKFIGCGFEASPSGAAAGDGIETFIDYRGANTSIVACHFNRNGEVYAIELGGQNNIVSACAFELNWAGAVRITGQYNVLTGLNASAAFSDIPTISFDGDNNAIVGSVLYFANGIYVNAGHCSVIGNRIKDCNVDTGTTYLIEATASGAAVQICNNRIRNQNSVRAVSPSGIGYGNVHAIVSGNYLHGNSAATGISVGAQDGIVSGNWLDGYTNEIVPNGHMADATIEGNFGFVTRAAGTGSIASGATSATITHGLAFTPARADISITLGESPTNTPGAIWVDSITSTQFNVNCENDPGASNLDFSWKARA